MILNTVADENTIPKYNKGDYLVKKFTSKTFNKVSDFQVKFVIEKDFILCRNNPYYIDNDFCYSDGCNVLKENEIFCRLLWKPTYGSAFVIISASNTVEGAEVAEIIGWNIKTNGRYYLVKTDKNIDKTWDNFNKKSDYILFDEVIATEATVREVYEGDIFSSYIPSNFWKFTSGEIVDTNPRYINKNLRLVIAGRSATKATPDLKLNPSYAIVCSEDNSILKYYNPLVLNDLNKAKLYNDYGVIVKSNFKYFIINEFALNNKAQSDLKAGQWVTLVGSNILYKVLGPGDFPDQYKIFNPATNEERVFLFEFLKKSPTKWLKYKVSDWVLANLNDNVVRVRVEKLWTQSGDSYDYKIKNPITDTECNIAEISIKGLQEKRSCNGC
jgi:hypothetical protein